MKKYGDDLDKEYEKSEKDVFWLASLISSIVFIFSAFGVAVGLIAVFDGGIPVLFAGSLTSMLLALVPMVLAAMGRQQKEHFAKTRGL